MKTIVTIRVEIDHDDHAARSGVRSGVRPEDVPAAARRFAEGVAHDFRALVGETTVTYQEASS